MKIKRFIYLKNKTTIKIGGFQFSEILDNRDSVSRQTSRSLYYPCPPEENQKLGFKYDIWLSLILHFKFLIIK
jgi:hypothetical protein